MDSAGLSWGRWPLFSFCRSMDFAEYSGPPCSGFLCFGHRACRNQGVRKGALGLPLNPAAAPPPRATHGPGNSALDRAGASAPAPSTMFCRRHPVFLWVIQATMFLVLRAQSIAFRPAARPCSDWCSTSPLRCFPGQREIKRPLFPPGDCRRRVCGVRGPYIRIALAPSGLRSGLRWHPMACSTH